MNSKNNSATLDASLIKGNFRHEQTSGIITHDFYQNFPNSDKNSDKNLNSDKNFDKQSRCRLESVT